MELTMADVAAQCGRTPRRVRQAVQTGRLPALRMVGRQILVDDVAAVAWTRAAGRGPLWRPRTREAALDLLSEGQTTALTGSQRSRLRAALRGMSVTDIAHAAGGFGGGWGRFRADPSQGLIGPSAMASHELGIVSGGSWMTFVETDDLDDWELDHGAVLDADGDVGVVERATGDSRVARVLLDCYLLGDARVSAAAASRLQERARAL